MSRRAVYLLAGFLMSTNLPAVTISVGELPAEIQACRMAGTCTVPLTSFIDVPNTSGSASHGGTIAPYAMSAFYMASGANFSYLLRYNLVEPSVALVEDTVQPLSGNVWLLVNSQYATGVSTPTVSLYLDRVNPLPPNLLPGHMGGLNLDISLNTNALLGGTAHQSISCCSDTSYLGNMSIAGSYGSEALLPCVADGCYASAQLNLLYLLFSDTDGDGILQTDFNPLDNRARLFTVQTYDPYGGLEGLGSGSSVSYYVSTVPLPPALYLFASGMLLLARRKRTRVAA